MKCEICGQTDNWAWDEELNFMACECGHIQEVKE